jgi:AraC family transcriptional regulator
LLLSAPKIRGTYRRGAGIDAYADLVDVIFIPKDLPLYCILTPGMQRCISCMFDIGGLSRRAGLEWSWPDFDPADTLLIRNDYVRAGMRRLAEEVLSPGFAAAIQIEYALMFVAFELRRLLHGAPQRAGGGRLSVGQLNLLRSMMVETSGKPPSIGQLAEACGMSGRQLAGAYRKTTGVTLRSFIAETALERAKALLLNRRALIKQVAFESGFQSSAAFTAAFRKAAGMTPVEYRRATTASVPC